MGDFFGNFYCWFQGLFGQNLADYLWGYSCETGDYTDPNHFFSIGLVTLAVTLAFAVFYYFIWKPVRWNRWWQWLLFAIGVSLVGLFVGVGFVLPDWSDGTIPDCLVYNENDIPMITPFTCWSFAMANFLVSFIEFFVLSIVIKRFTNNCYDTPWHSLFPKK